MRYGGLLAGHPKYRIQNPIFQYPSSYSAADRLSEHLSEQREINTIDFTPPGARREVISFSWEAIVVVGVPVYAGRVPNVLLKYLKSIAGYGALAVVVVLFGNRDYEDALIELQDILEGGGFKVVDGGAFIEEHSFSRTLGWNSPDERDMAVAADFGQRIYEKIA